MKTKTGWEREIQSKVALKMKKEWSSIKIAKKEIEKMSVFTEC